MKKYDLIYCDPPWDYKNKVSNGAAKNHYPTTSLFNLTHIPIILLHLITQFLPCGIQVILYSRLLN